ncbi:RNA 2'-phosphotransferase [Tahibacter harae]|uniref:Probable RNA 2'-phosphotransferase n=1 Tax=Tahibacter harae TaxID=2963937 RepID=A0ABT1QQG1_9GAMM|nr:RNA 2'-phosphotransferase [Tahibacter harae]MCQ4164513.1 RNA 2'-phosphotransferase [Tahibacter harae]
MSEPLPPRLVKLSKFLSLILRHQPETIGLTLDAQGWADIAELLHKAAAAGRPIEREDLDQVIADNDKKRFTLSADGLRLRAAQGHSTPVQLDLPARTPPQRLYHGTATRFLDAILAEGLKPQARQHVHLSTDIATALDVGSRHGRAVVLGVDAAAMEAAGCRFFQADNGVWLTAAVPAQFLRPLDAEA